jgi:hypothetical protein
MALAPEMVNGTEAAAASQITIKRLNMQTIALRVVGAAPYMQLRFSEKARGAMRAKMAAGSTPKNPRANRAARDFDADYEAAMYVTEGGRRGIPASAFRNAAIDACRMAGFVMTKAKCSIFVLADDADIFDGTPLVFIEGEPRPNEMTVRNETGVADIRVRARWETWAASITIQFDADQFKAEDVANLIERAGIQVGIGEGRPFSKRSNGLGLGTFRIERD